MKFEVKVPAVGESITEATIGSWAKENGAFVQQNDLLMTLETDKATVEVVAEQSGVLQILVPAGQTIPIGTLVAAIDTEAHGAVSVESVKPQPQTIANAPARQGVSPVGVPAPGTPLSPAVQRVVAEYNLDPRQIAGTGKDGRLTKQDAILAAKSAPQTKAVPAMAAGAADLNHIIEMPSPTAFSSAPTGAGREMPKVVAPMSPSMSPSTSPSTSPSISAPPPASIVAATGASQKRVPMTSIRKRIAERLLLSQQTTATLTTFNEIDMTQVASIRARYKEAFKEKYGVNLGFMGFFVKATIEALKAWPQVNAFIDGQDLIYNNYYNIGVAVGTEKGLIVPVIKDADRLSVAGVEGAIKNFATKARDGKISVDDLSGGTFTISNGGVYGSLMSTPILNPPQSAILGLHKMQERPIVVAGKVEVRTMMYVALSYDHRIIDGKEAVSFLVKIKECIENPERILLEI